MNEVVAVAPDAPWLREALGTAGIPAGAPGPDTRGLVWLGFHDPAGLGAVLARCPAVTWVQLPSAGVDDFVAAGVLDPRIMWTSAKGAYARPVAEHALALLLASLRELPRRVRAEHWGQPGGRALYGRRVLVIGAGGVGLEVVRLLRAFGADVTVVRRTPVPVPGARQTVGADDLTAVLPDADAVIVAAAATNETRALLGARELALLPADAVLVNVARGSLVDTAALLACLRSGHLGAAALDVTDPEPLPTGHPLWREARVIVTPHTADTWEMIRPLLIERVVTNARRFVGGEPLVGVVDVVAGY